MSQIPPSWVIWNGDVISEEEIRKAKIDVLLTLGYIWAEPNNNVGTKNGLKTKKGNKKEMPKFCAFCKNNGASYKEVNSHNTKTCPRLQSYKCPTCGCTGHTIRYCPKKQIITPEDLAGLA